MTKSRVATRRDATAEAGLPLAEREVGQLAAGRFSMTCIIKSYISVACVVLLLTPAAGFAADPPQSTDPAPGSQRPLKEDGGMFGRITSPYRAAVQPPN